MRVLTVLFDEENQFENEKAFGGKSAQEICKDFFEKAEFMPEGSENAGVKIINKNDCSTTAELFAKLSEFSSELKADCVIFSYSDLPFINSSLSKRLITTHIEYKCEYTFADGFAYGFAPEVLDSGAINILAELSKGTMKEEGSKKICRQSVYNLIKTDINSFEVETELSDTDWRLFRFNFCCSNKDSFLQCKNLFELSAVSGASASSKLCDEDCEKLTEKASKSEKVLKTVPGFYEIQIAEKTDLDSIYSPYSAAYKEKFGTAPENSEKIMDFEKIAGLVDRIAEFSGSAVISLSAWGEAFYHPQLLQIIEKILSYSGLSVFIQTSGLLVTEDFCLKLKSIWDSAAERTNGWQKVMISVCLDAFTSETYLKMNQPVFDKAEGFNKAMNGVSLLCKALPGSVYPQFTRTNHNESELEAFFRFWNEKSNPSGGNLIIQKYNDYSGLLSQEEPADLSPVERGICWHLRRDMTILADGSVTLCRSSVLGNKGDFDQNAVTGNVFTENLEEIWKKSDGILINHINCRYCKSCGKCDEYYTFNF